MDILSYLGFAALASYALVQAILVRNRYLVRTGPDTYKSTEETTASTMGFWLFFGALTALGAIGTTFLDQGSYRPLGPLLAVIVGWFLVFWGAAWYADRIQSGLVVSTALHLDVLAVAAGVWLAARDFVKTKVFEKQVVPFLTYYGVAGGLLLLAIAVAIVVILERRSK